MCACVCVSFKFSFQTVSNLNAGLGIPRLMEAVLKLLPMDTYVPSPVLS